MFSLSTTAKHNLEAILHEFHRASFQYGPLCHERFHAWKDGQEESVNDEGWLAFIEAAKSNFPEDEWYEWDRSFYVPGWSYSSLARWFGDPSGRGVLVKLLGSVLDVLEREDLSAFPHIVIPFDFRSVEGWIGTLHSWAFRIQSILLTCDMTPWNIENEDCELDDVTSIWINEIDGVNFPQHPLRFTLEHDLFTSSMAAIRALLWPELVLGFNEPWPLSSTGCRVESVADTTKEKQTSDQKCHTILKTQVGWEVYLFDKSCRIAFSQQAGLHRIAMLIKHYPKEWCPTELSSFGARSVSKLGKTANRQPEYYDSNLSLSTTKRRQRPDSRTASLNNDILEKLKELKADLPKAIKEGDDLYEQEIQKELRMYSEMYHDNDEKGPESKAKDSIRSSIRKTLSEMRLHVNSKSNADELLAAVDQLERQIDTAGPSVRFKPKQDCTPWQVHD